MSAAVRAEPSDGVTCQASSSGLVTPPPSSAAVFRPTAVPSSVLPAQCTSDTGESSDGSSTDDSDPDFKPGRAMKKKRVDVPLTLTSEALDASDVGSRKASKIVSAYAVARGDAPVARSRIQRALEKS